MMKPLNVLSSARRHLVTLSVALAAMAAPVMASAQAPYPNRPITLIVPFGLGGETDIFARALSQDLGEALGQSIVVVNRAGATGMIGTEAVVRSKPDGYTLVFGTAATHALNMVVYKKVPYHPLKDFEPVALVGTVPVILYTHPSMPGNARDFIAKLKADPQKYFYGSAGLSTTYLSVEMFLHAAQVPASNVVSYKGNGEAMQALVGGQVQFLGASLGLGRELVKGGKLNAVAVMSDKRLAAAPEIPTLAESASLPLSVGTWNVVMAPVGTPKEIVDRLNHALNEVLKKPSLQSRLTGYGISPVTDSTPASTAKFVEAEIVKWREAFKLTGLETQ
ncbi:tripartite tricarboxylate transporter substrate binding protein [Hydrogenophaga sp. 2FB]|uniref:Bug family tripartite tricarboxylate transporter substrate binding protein n=1 Tax=Hydrogenophaga sp. 2FB TaxID=2502187 RepID=UPI001485A32F|nr:tripartite tricarboxylate transporter substrate binding protein [Hydrogenophaga sp. 2FB]